MHPPPQYIKITASGSGRTKPFMCQDFTRLKLTPSAFGNLISCFRGQPEMKVGGLAAWTRWDVGSWKATSQQPGTGLGVWLCCTTCLPNHIQEHNYPQPLQIATRNHSYLTLPSHDNLAVERKDCFTQRCPSQFSPWVSIFRRNYLLEEMQTKKYNKSRMEMPES